MTTICWRRAAAIWATARNASNVTAPPDALDGDALVAAQAIEEGAVIVTTNTPHIEVLSAKALEWSEVSPSPL
ncbi:MAG TPA: hypothetical protein VGY54_22860 [Polyangiaceae bacterium]|nr:hypothetical protein [Polyangiaceae bacterium]